MAESLLDENLRVKEKWLREPFNKTICRYLDGYWDLLEDLNQYNDEFDDIQKNTDLVAMFSTLNIAAFKDGIVIEDTTVGYYTLSYYSFDGEVYKPILERY